MPEYQELQELEPIQVYTKDDWLNRMYRKSESEGTMLQGKTSLNCFLDFCTYQNKTEKQVINELQMLAKTKNARNLGLALDRFVQFMNEAHPEITRIDPLQEVRRTKDPTLPERKIGFKRKGAKTIKSYFGFVKSYLRLCHDVRISSEDVKDYIAFPKIRKEPRKPITIDILKLICNNANPLRRAFYNVLITSGMRLGEALQLTKGDIHFNESPVRVTIRANTTKTKEGRETYISFEAVDKIRILVENKEDDEKIFMDKKHLKRAKSIKLAVANEDHVFAGLREKLGREDKRFREKYPESDRYVVNIHSFRAYFHTHASETHGMEYANALDGHSGYLPQYYRKSPEERAKMYLELEPRLLIESIKPDVEKTKDMIINDLQIQMQKLQEKMQRIDELKKPLEA